MINKIRMAGVICVGLLMAALLAIPTGVSAQESHKAFQACDVNPTASICRERGANVLPDRVRNIINLLLYVVGIVAVIIIVIGGLRYALSGGDSTGINNAKNTVIYAAIGLVVAILAYAIVNFVLGWFT